MENLAPENHPENDWGRADGGMPGASAPPPPYRWRGMTDLEAFRKLMAAARMKGRQFRRAYGPDGRGLIPVLFTPEGKPRFHDIRLTYRGGSVRAIRAGSVCIDLDNPGASPDELRRIYQPSSCNAARRMAGICEEAGAEVFGSPNARWYDAAHAAGMSAEDAEALALNTALRTRCNSALVAELYRGMTPAEAPLYAALRALPISIRHRCGWLVDPAIDYDLRLRGSQLINQLPLTALMWGRAQRAATEKGSRLKDLAAEWGLPKSANKIQASSLSSINYRLAIDGRGEEATQHELAPLDEPLCAALPEVSFKNKLVVDLTILAASQGLEPGAASEIGRWAVPHIAHFTRESDLPEATRAMLADYCAASPEALADAGGVEPWHRTMTLSGAVDTARAYIEGLNAAQDGGRDARWPVPNYAIEGAATPPEKGRGWFPYFLGSKSQLRWGGTHFKNCAGGYTAECAAGRRAVYAILRRPIKTDRPGSLIELPGHGLIVRGAMLDLRPTPGGKCRRAQLCGVANAPEATLPDSLRHAVRRWIDAANARPNHHNDGE